MKFSTREDIEAPIGDVFDMLCEFNKFERAAMRRGAEVRRLDTLTTAGEGAEWFVRFMLRGKEREMNLTISQFNRPEEMVVNVSSQGILGEMTFELIALSLRKTRMIVALELRPLTLPARLLLQSLKLTKTTLNRRYKERVAEYASTLQQRISDKA